MRAAHLLPLIVGANARWTREIIHPAAKPPDPHAYGWVQNFGAFGDSYTAGIGAGVVGDGPGDVSCKRYSLSYAGYMSQFLADSNSFTFKNVACSGASSTDVYTQLDQIDDHSLDALVGTVGGNDLCLESLISTCVLDARATASDCDSVVNLSQTFIDRQLAENLLLVINKAKEKLHTNGVLVIGQYAQFFDESSQEPCNSQEDWSYLSNWNGRNPKGLPIAVRQQLNQLVKNANAVISATVEQAQLRQARSSVFIETANWDAYVGATHGRFCLPGEAPLYADPANRYTQFFRLDNQLVDGELKAFERPVTVNHSAPVLARAPIPNVCPPQSLPIPVSDEIGKMFHPNTLGHQTLATFFLDAIANARAKLFSIRNPSCG